MLCWMGDGGGVLFSGGVIFWGLSQLWGMCFGVRLVRVAVDLLGGGVVGWGCGVVLVCVARVAVGELVSFLVCVFVRSCSVGGVGLFGCEVVVCAGVGAECCGVWVVSAGCGFVGVGFSLVPVCLLGVGGGGGRGWFVWWREGWGDAGGVCWGLFGLMLGVGGGLSGSGLSCGGWVGLCVWDLWYGAGVDGCYFWLLVVVGAVGGSLGLLVGGWLFLVGDFAGVFGLWGGFLLVGVGVVVFGVGLLWLGCGCGGDGWWLFGGSGVVDGG
ncbi:hypothetical protein Tco_0401638 [Tanacetum coccineum]